MFNRLDDEGYGEKLSGEGSRTFGVKEGTGHFRQSFQGRP